MQGLEDTAGRQATARLPLRVFKAIPTTVEWLDHLARQRGLALAPWLGVDASQVSNWRGHDPLSPQLKTPLSRRLKPYRPVPREHLFAAMVQSGHDGLLLPRLRDVEDMVADLVLRAEALDPSRQLVRMLVNQIDSLLDAEHFLPLSQTVHDAVRFLACARQCVMELKAALDVGFAEPVLHQGNIGIALQFPSNVFAGCLLQSPWIKALEVAPARSGLQSLLAALRRQVRSGSRSDSWAQVYCTLHAVHLLNRFGTAEDRAMVKHELSASPIAGWPVTQHMTVTALVIAEQSPELAADFARKLQVDDELCGASLAFDALHYGDTAFRAGALALPASYHRTLLHMAMRVAAADVHAPMRAVLAVKLWRLLQRCPPGSIRSVHDHDDVMKHLGAFILDFKLDQTLRKGLIEVAREHRLL